MIKETTDPPPSPSVTDPPEPPPSPSQTIHLAKGARVYVSTQGDWWDLIAIKVYGAKRGNEHLMYRLIEANYYLRDVSHFPAGVAVVVPALQIETDIPLVPWKKASVIP